MLELLVGSRDMDAGNDGGVRELVLELLVGSRGVDVGIVGGV